MPATGRVVLLGIGLPVIAVLATLWPSVHAVWTERATYSHGYLILGIALWLVWRELRRGPVQPDPSVLGAAGLAGVLVAAAIGRAGDVALLAQLAVVAVPFAALWAASGWRGAQRFLMPAAYMVFAMPIWDAINDLLRDLTVVVTGAMTRAAAIPAFIDGNFISIPSGTFEVSGGCSGLHYLIVACALGTLYGVLTFRSGWLRLAALALSIALALLANWIRVFVIIVAGHLTDMQHYLVTVDHYYFGWILFLAVFSMLFVAGRFVEWPQGNVGAELPSEAPRGAAVGTTLWDGRIVASMVMLSGAAWLSFAAGARPESPPAAAEQQVAALPSLEPEWRADGEWSDDTQPHFVNWTRAGSARFYGSDGHVSVYVAHYAVQAQGREVIYYANLPAGERAQPIARSTRLVELASGQEIGFAEQHVKGIGTGERLVWTSYRIAGLWTADAAVAKLYQVIGGARQRWDADVIVLSSPCVTDCAAARQALETFARDTTTLLLDFVRQIPEPS